MKLRTSTSSTRVHGFGNLTDQTLDHEYDAKVRLHPSSVVTFSYCQEISLLPTKQAPIEVCHHQSQSHTTITLCGPTLFFILSSSAIFLMHLEFHLSISSSILAFLPLAYLIHHDYKSFLSLGPGGTPSTFAGYLKITYLRLYTLSDPFIPPPPSVEPTNPASGYFQHTQTALPTRQGRRPTVAGIAPQRQKDSFPPLDIYLRLRRTWISTAASQPESLETAKSCFEKQGLALFAKESSRVNETCRGEIAHVHAIDGSFHMSLHPSDVAEILNKGWGQRHPLAGRGPGVVMGQLGRKIRGYARWLGWKGRDGEGRAIVPNGFVLVYAPRDEGEAEVVGRIVGTAAWWVMGTKIELEQGKDEEMDLEKLRREAGVKEDDRVPEEGRDGSERCHAGCMR